MRILLLINSLSAGGAEVFVTDLAIAFAEQRHEVALFAYAGILDDKGARLHKQLRAAGVKFVSPTARTLLRKSIVPIHLARFFNTFRPDVVHSHLEQSDLLTFLAQLIGRPQMGTLFVRTLHSVYAPKRLPRFVHLTLMKFFNMTVACGNHVAESYPYLDRSKLEVIDNGIRIDTLRGSENGVDIRLKLGIPQTSSMLVNVGSFSLRDGRLPKAQDVMIDALARLKRTDVHLVFVGDGEKRCDMEDRARKHGLDGQIHFTGLVDCPSKYMEAADLIVMPSRFEGLSIACIEAACLAKPIIVSNLEAFATFIGTSTAVVEPGDIESLKSGLNRALRDFVQLRQAAFEKQEYFRRVFDVHAVGDKYLKVYQCRGVR